LLHDDALDYLKRDARDWSEWKMVANLPFSVASPLLVELALAARGPERMVGTLQIEVAKRLHAEPGAPDYGVLTLLVQLNYEPQPWFKIPPSCFFPEPDVDSACFCLVRREPPPLTDDQRGVFIRLVKRSFSQRRKMMLKLLKQDWPQPRLAQEFERLNLSPQIRAEKVSREQFIQLARNLTEAPAA
jgi:16S rRNA (adenine1518-N6/adenine1519-N6)-dimethyltransferase